jgi:hypothetical protein
MRNAYYKSHKEGKKEIISDKYSQQYGNGDMVESKESFSGNIERLIDKIEKNAMLKKNILMKPDAQKIFKEKFNISQDGVRKINSWLEEEDNQDELRYFFELAFTSLKPKNESDICRYDIQNLAYRITSAKKDQNLIKAKEILDHILEDILGNKYKSLGSQRIYQLKTVIAYSLMIYAKIMLCKKL